MDKNMDDFARNLRTTQNTVGMRSFYKKKDKTYALTLALLENEYVAFEGLPGVGKTSAVLSCADAMRTLGAHVVVHEEDRDQHILDVFATNQKQNAFWFQLFKLGKRQRLCEALEHRQREHETEFMDRTLPGDMAFALYHYAMGNMTEQQFEAYMNELTKIAYRTPFLVIYLTASPETLVKRVRARGFEWEIATYDTTYFNRMDQCYRTALDVSGCNYCVINWDDDVPSVAAHWNAKTRMLIPLERCMALLETAIELTYGPNIERINATRIDPASMLVPGSGISMFGARPAELAERTREALRKSGEKPQAADPVDQ